MRARRNGGMSRGARIVWVLAALLCAGAVPAVAEEEKSAGEKTSPAAVRLDRARLAGLELGDYPPMSKETVLEGSDKHRGHVFFNGKEIVVEVWEAETAKLSIDEPFPYDEFVYILSGKLILTDAQGNKTEYVAGDSLVVPLGFIGIWEMIGDYRELIVIEKKAYERAESTD